MVILKMKTYRNGGRNMKRITVYAISFLSLAVLFTTCYFLSYKYALKQFNDSATEQSGEIRNLSIQDSQDVAVKQKTTVSVDAAYVEQIYDIVKDEQTEEIKNIPNEFVGLNRQEILHRLNAYMQNKPLDEYIAGLVSYELVNFTPDKIVVKKTYNSEAIVYKYYMAIENGEIVVYYSDKETVYDGNTGVFVEDLSEEDKIKLMYGVYVEDEAEIYSKLENYTS